MREAYIVAYGRSAVAKAKKGALFHERPDDVASRSIKRGPQSYRWRISP